jgi:lysophospholipase L1-like esterase
MSPRSVLSDMLRAARNAPRGVRSGMLVIVIAALASTVTGFAYFEMHGTDLPHTQAEPSDGAPSVSTMFDHKPTLLVVGDSYARGIDDPRLVPYPYLVADKMGWNVADDAQDGTGFVRGVDNVSPLHVPFIDRLDRDAATYHVDYVLIDGGRNDLDEPPHRVVAAADAYIKKVHSDWPSAKIIVMLPSYARPDVAVNSPAVAQGLRATAQSVGAYVIDPEEQRWYRGIDVKPMLLQDGIHLNSDGNTYYTDKVVDNLKQMFDHKPELLVIGDSFAGGTGDPAFVTYPYLVAHKMGWNLALDAQAGTGFVSGVDSVSPPLVRFMDRLDRDAATYHPDYILIDGGRSDLGLLPDPVVAAADEYLKDVHSHFPNAKIIIVLPSYAIPDVAGNYPALAQGLRRAADSVGAYVIDPVVQRWYRDIDLKPLLWRDGVHLNSDGNIYYADKIIENLKRMSDYKHTLLVVGDSYAGGVGDPAIVPYPYLVAEKMRWNVLLDAQGGTGFIRGVDSVSPPHVPFMNRLDGDARYHPDYVLIDGGRNDLDEPPDRVVAAADAYIKKVRSDWPDAKIIIMLPSYITPDAAVNYPAVAQGLRATAQSVGASVIDPVEQRWYRGIDVKPLLWLDGIHPNSNGQIYYADKVVENLKQMGFAS